PGFLAGLEVAVLPSHSEGMSNALLEYMAAGRAIVATAVGSNPRLIEDGVHGLVGPANDPARAGGAGGGVPSGRRLAARLGQAARRRVEQHFSRAAMVRRFEAFYLGLREGALGLRLAPAPCTPPLPPHPQPLSPAAGERGDKRTYRSLLRD